jgi:hypothetical protein
MKTVGGSNPPRPTKFSFLIALLAQLFIKTNFVAFALQK